MIIFGSKAKQIAAETSPDQCPNCGASNSVQFYVLQKYAHVFWIPFFPTGKSIVSQCSNCKQALRLKEMSSSMALSSDNLKSQSKTPVWTFAGLALVVVLVTLGIINDKKKDEKNAKLVLAPQRGDIFEIKTEENQYTLYKIDEVQGDSVFIRINNYETNKLTGLDDLKRKGQNAYSEDVFSVTKADLKKMLDKGEVIDIERQ